MHVRDGITAAFLLVVGVNGEVNPTLCSALQRMNWQDLEAGQTFVDMCGSCSLKEGC